MDSLLLMNDMTDNQRMLFQSEYNKVEKDSTTAFLFTFFLGGIGAHHFYLGNTGRGVVCALFFWTFIPALIAFFELFTISRKVRRMNEQNAMNIAIKVKALANSRPLAG